MKNKRNIFLTAVAAILFSFLFHRQALGLNLLLFQVLILSWAVLSRTFQLKGLLPLTIGGALLTTAIFTVLTHSAFSYAMNVIAMALFVGILIYPEAKSLLTSMGLAIVNFFLAQILFIEEMLRTNIRGNGLGKILWKTRIFTIPLGIILLFTVIYAHANPVFMQLIENVGNTVDVFLTRLFQDFDAWVILTFLLGLWMCNQFFFRGGFSPLIQLDQSAQDQLLRKQQKQPHTFKFTALKNEYKAGIFLLLFLNLILLVVNCIDIHWVWFNFEWEGQYLKQFVHEGTYLLILSILISVAVVLFFFRGNLNFYARNRLLKYLGYGWIAQNIVLAISVAIRNFYYIDHFALAYKRIGVIIFLFLTIVGLVTVIFKIHRRKHTFYLLRINALSIFITLVVSSCVNWDALIARYNFAHSGSAFLHLDFMATLSDKTLPALDKTLPELEEMDGVQKVLFPFEAKYMTPGEYHQTITRRKQEFITRWEEKNLLEWNLPEYLAYRKLKGSE